MTAVSDSKRCFQCGATYAPDVLSCQLDETPLCFETIGRRWRVDGLLVRRKGGGGAFAAFHLVSSEKAVIDHIPWPLTEDPKIGGRLYREVQALRLLERHPHVPRLMETGTDRDGSRFAVLDLGESRLLQELMDEWRGDRVSGGGLVQPARATQLLSPVLSLLSMAHRMGMCHGQIDTGQIFVGPGGSGEVVRLHGLAVLQPAGGDVPAEAVRMDLRAVAGLLHELLVGRQPSAGHGPSAALGLKLAAVLERALSDDPALGFGSAEEFARALLLAAPPPVSLNSGAHRVSMILPVLQQPGGGVPQASQPGVSGPMRVGSGPMGLVGGTLGVTQQHSAQPAPLTPLAAPLPKAGLTTELEQIRVLDLLDQGTPRAKSDLFELPKGWPRLPGAQMPVEWPAAGAPGGPPDEMSYVDIQVSEPSMSPPSPMARWNPPVEEVTGDGMIAIDLGPPSSGSGTPWLPPEPDPLSSITNPGLSRTGASNPNLPRTGASNPNLPRTGASNPNLPRSAVSTPNQLRSAVSTPSQLRSAASTPSFGRSGISTPNGLRTGASNPNLPRSGASSPDLARSSASSQRVTPSDVSSSRPSLPGPSPSRPPPDSVPRLAGPPRRRPLSPLFWGAVGVLAAVAASALVLTAVRHHRASPPLRPAGINQVATPVARPPVAAPLPQTPRPAAAPDCPVAMLGLPGVTRSAAGAADQPLPPFCLDQDPVSVLDYRRCERHRLCTPPGERHRHHRFPLTAEQAAAYCTAQGKRLPTDAELAHAAPHLAEHQDPGLPISAGFRCAR